MIVISTPTGQVGSQVLTRVLAGGAPVRVIVRDPSRLPADVRDRVEIVQGSTDDVRVVDEAFAGADTVFWLVPPNPRAPSVPGHLLDFVRPLCEALTNHDVRRAVGVSSLGRGVAHHAGQISAVFAMDDLVESTGVHYRALCMPGYMENMLWQVEPLRSQGTFFQPTSGTRKVPTCATRDIATVAADLLLDQSWTGQAAVPVLGPEDLSCHDQAEIMSEVLDRPIRFQQITPDAYKASLTQHGMSEAWAQGLCDMSAAVDRGIYATAPGTSRAATPTTFRQWCEDTLAPAVLG